MILCIETSTSTCSVALCDARGLVAERLERHANHAACLTPLIEELLRPYGWNALQAVAVGAGPGSYTGLRIGASTAKAICYARRLPLLAISSLQALTQAILQADQSCRTALALLDARRDEVYELAQDCDGNTLLPERPRIVDAVCYGTILATPNVTLGGSGAHKVADLYPGAHVIDDLEPLARHLATLAMARLVRRDFDDTAYFEPNYLKQYVPDNPQNKVLRKALDNS